jgi:hypothetical protein
LPRTSISSAIPLTSMVDLPSARAISSLPPFVRLPFCRIHQ